MNAPYVEEINETVRAVPERSLAGVFNKRILLEQVLFNRRLCYNTNKAT